MYMVLSQRFVPSEIRKPPLAVVIEDAKQPPMVCSPSKSMKKPLTGEMKIQMRNFYERSMKMNILNFEESVREVVRCQAKDVKLYASSVSSKKNGSLVRVRSSAQAHLYGKIKVFLEHNVNCSLQTLWMYLFDTITTSHRVCHISDKHIFQRLVHVNLLEEPAVYAKKDGGMDILNVGHLNM